MHKNSAEERDMIGGGVESRQSRAEDPAESDEKSETLLTVFPYCFEGVESRGEDFS